MNAIPNTPSRDLSSATGIEPLPAEQFDEVFRTWIRVQQEDFERNGLWSDGLVRWQGDGSSGGAS